jgi:hypothetical protein
MIRTRLLYTTIAVLVIGAGAASAQTYKMTTPFAPGVAVPDKIESSIGIAESQLRLPVNRYC